MTCLFPLQKRPCVATATRFGLEFQESMVTWPPIPANQLEEFTAMGDAYKLAQESTAFLPSTLQAAVIREEFSDAINASIDKEMPLYEEFRELARTFVA